MLLFLMILNSLAEVLSIGAIFPFISVMINPDLIIKNSSFNEFLIFFNVGNIQDPLIFFTIVFLIMIVFAGFTRLLTLYGNIFLSFSVGSDVSIEIFRKTLHQPFALHISRNSSEIISSITSKVNTSIFGVLLPILVFISALLILILIFIMLLFLNPKIAIISIFGFGALYFLAIFYVRKKLSYGGAIIASYSNRNVKILQESLGGIRDVILGNMQKIYSFNYAQIDKKLKKYQASNSFYTQSPRIIIETVAISAIAFVIFLFIDSGGNLANNLPLFGLIALSFQRAMPVLQQLYGSWSEVKGNRASLEDVLDLLDQKIMYDFSSYKKLPFEKNIELRDISFTYNREKRSNLSNINLLIKKGESIGVIGETGSGKSTLIDIIMGLLEPSQGQLLIDGKVISLDNNSHWYTNIAHVPQNIFLTDSTISENIALGIEPKDLNSDKVIKATRLACLSEFIDSLEQGLETRVGERGFQFSGGQRQRIGIARAFYNLKELLILDEATSSLDIETETKIIKNINAIKDLTLIMISHRLSSLEMCDRIFEVRDGRLIEFKKGNNYAE